MPALKTGVCMFEKENIQSDRIRQSLYSLFGRDLVNSILEKKVEELMLNPDGKMFVKCRDRKSVV